MTTPVVVPAALVASHERYNGDAGRRWVAALPGLAEDLLARWDLRLDGAPMHGAVSLVLPVQRADGTPAVLKLLPVDDETAGEALALRAWAGRPVVRLLEHDLASGSMLLERLDASRSLETMTDGRRALTILAELLASLTAVAAPAGLRTLSAVIGRTLDETPTALAHLQDATAVPLLETCRNRVAELAAGPLPNQLLHWDLHYSNVLTRPADATWTVIDPKPLGGDPAFELLPALWNRWDDVERSGDVAAAVLARFDLLTEVTGIDRERAAAWTLGRVLQNAVWELTADGSDGSFTGDHRTIAEVLLTRYA